MMTRHPMLRVLALMFALVVAAPTLAACGSDEKTEKYDSDGKKVVDQFQTDVQAVQTKLQSAGQDPEAVASGIEEMRGAFDKAANGLSELDPPEDAKPTHDKFVSQLRAFGPDLNSLATAAREQDAEKVQQLQGSFQSRLAELQQTADDLKKQLNE